MDFNTAITEYKNGNIIIEDVVYDVSMDGDTYEVTLCGPYGVEISTMTLNYIEFDCLKEDDLTDVNFLVAE